MGKGLESGLSKRIYQCTNNKHDFAKAYSLVKEIHHPRFQYWKALFILNGWGGVKQDYNKAYELFSKTQGLFYTLIQWSCGESNPGPVCL